MSSESEFGYSLKYNTHFIVRNITGLSVSKLHLERDNPAIPPPYRSEFFYISPKKTISIFNYPINAGQTRDLFQIPGIQESDIRSSLLKGVIRHKLLCGDIELVSSNIDLLQVSPEQRDWLHSFGFDDGVMIKCDQLHEEVFECIDGYITTNHPPGSLNYAWREKIPLIGLRNGLNQTFYTPEKFINGSYFGNLFHLTIEHNGKELYENIDYTIGESSGAGTGYDTINIYSITPVTHSLLFATYVVKI
jgi:hypothetical protein